MPESHSAGKGCTHRLLASLPHQSNCALLAVDIERGQDVASLHWQHTKQQGMSDHHTAPTYEYMSSFATATTPATPRNSNRVSVFAGHSACQGSFASS